MTVCVVIKVQDCIVFAADSAEEICQKTRAYWWMWPLSSSRLPELEIPASSSLKRVGRFIWVHRLHRARHGRGTARTLTLMRSW